jgi:hypothetical protein
MQHTAQKRYSGLYQTQTTQEYNKMAHVPHRRTTFDFLKYFSDISHLQCDENHNLSLIFSCTLPSSRKKGNTHQKNTSEKSNEIICHGWKQM